jgi:NAD(P)-dependent dehydrogenase (short-subunit alcohol dehydrogenase family)
MHERYRVLAVEWTVVGPTTGRSRLTSNTSGLKILPVGTVKGSVALVTGAGWGFGPGIARALAAGGADVALVDVTREATEELATAIAALGRRAVSLACDLRDAVQIATAVASAEAELGPIDILVNNGQRWADDSGGPAPLLAVDELSEEAWDNTFDVGVKAAFLCSKAVFPSMKERGGKIINVGSDAGVRGSAKRAHAAGSAEALRALTKCTAFDWGRYGINVNVMSPSVNSDPSAPPAPAEPDGRRVITGAVTQDDAGALAVFLAGAGTDYVTGQTFIVGGRAVL